MLPFFLIARMMTALSLKHISSYSAMVQMLVIRFFEVYCILGSDLSMNFSTIMNFTRGRGNSSVVLW